MQGPKWVGAGFDVNQSLNLSRRVGTVRAREEEEEEEEGGGLHGVRS